VPNSITLAADVAADRSRVFQILSSTEGQRGFWTADCEVGADRARFGFALAPMDLVTTVETEPDALVRMKVLTGFPFWDGSIWEWKLSPAYRAESGTSVLFKHYGFGDGYKDIDLGHTAQTWAMVLDRLVSYAAGGVAQPYFAAQAPTS
jgi:hypothetical protein